MKAELEACPVPAGLIGEVLGIHPHGEVCAVAFTNADEVQISRRCSIHPQVNVLTELV